MAKRGGMLFGVPPGTPWELVIDPQPRRNEAADRWHALHGHRPQLTDRELRAIALSLTIDPYQIGGEHDWEIYLLAKRFLEAVPYQSRLTPRELAALIDKEVDLGWPLGEARQRVADACGRTVPAVRQAHLRYGKNVVRKAR
jgi:hypothetical protein